MTRFDYPQFMFPGQRYSAIKVTNMLDVMAQENERKSIEGSVMMDEKMNSFRNEWDYTLKRPQTFRQVINNMP